MLAAFLDRISKWLRKRQKRFAYAWTIECSRSQGHHTHLLLSAGRLDGEDLRDLLRGLPRLLVGDDTPLHPRVIRAEPTKARLPYDRRRFDRISRTEDQRRGLISYICKGLHQDAAAASGINAEDQGEVRFRRCGVSRSLDWAARRQAGWQALDQFDFSDLAVKHRQGLAMAVQRRSGAPGSPLPTRPPFPMPEPSRAWTGLGDAPTASAAP